MDQVQALDALLGLFEPAPDDPLWWLSFVDAEKAQMTPRRKRKPGGPAFLGVVITQAPNVAAAITRSHALGVNPGGEIGIKGPIPVRYIAAEWRDRLLTFAEVEAIPDPDDLQ